MMKRGFIVTSGDKMTIEIWSSNGFRTVVDDVDKDLKKYSWYYSKKGYFKICKGSLHHIIAKRMGLEIDGLTVDHKDTDPTNNRRSNLRVATRSQQCWNNRKRKRNTSGYKGVSFYRASNKWRAAISVFGKSFHLGLFSTPEEAHEAYVEAAKKHFGEFYNPG